jgi:hypothetical protein
MEGQGTAAALRKSPARRCERSELMGDERRKAMVPRRRREMTTIYAIHAP